MSCDGVLLFTPESYEPEAVAAARAWTAETGRTTYLCGPLLPTGSQAAANEKKQSKETAEIEEFLETTLKTSGEKSLLYVSAFRTCSGSSGLGRTIDVLHLDLLRLRILACEYSREAVGLPGRSDGTKCPVCMSFGFDSVSTQTE